MKEEMLEGMDVGTKSVEKFKSVLISSLKK